MSWSLRCLLVSLSLVASSPAFAGDDPGDAGPVQRGAVKHADKSKKDAPPDPDEPASTDDEPDDPSMDGLKDKPDAAKPVHDHNAATDEDDFNIERPPPPPPPQVVPKQPGPIDLDVAGKTPLADNYALSVVAIDRDDVVVELPVLLAAARASVPKGFMVVADVFVGDAQVNEIRQIVTPPSLAEFGPSFAFLKLMAPVTDKTGEIKVIVKKANLDGTSPVALFTRVTPYTLR